MTCADLLAALNEYVDGTIEPATCAEFESHLVGCDPCKVVVDNVRGTIKLFRDGAPYDLPEGFRVRLHSVLRDRWNRV